MNPKIVAIVLLVPLNLAMLAQKSMGQATAAAQGRGVTSKLTPCRVPDVEEEVLCGRYEVYENRAAGTGRKIGLNIVVLPAKTADVAPDPLVFLAGGGVVLPLT